MTLKIKLKALFWKIQMNRTEQIKFINSRSVCLKRPKRRIKKVLLSTASRKSIQSNNVEFKNARHFRKFLRYSNE